MKKLFIIFVLLFFSLQYIFAQWEPTNGPEGGHIKCIGVIENEIYAGGALGGIFKSSKNEIKWQSKSTTLNNTNIISNFAFFENKIFVATGNGVLFSSDKGENWNRINNGLTNLFTFDIININNKIFVGTAEGVFISTNLGNSWEKKVEGIDLNLIPVHCLTKKQNEIFVGLGAGKVGANYIGGGIYKSTDLGESWKLIGLEGQSVEKIKLSDENIYAATINGFYISTDDGSTWQSKSTGINEELKSIGVNNNYYFAGTPKGLFISSNQGNFWTKSKLTNSWVYNITELEGKIYVCCGEGLFMSSNNGETWDNLNSGFSGTQVFDMISYKNKIFAGTYESGLSITEDDGETWIKADSGLTEKSFFRIKAYDDIVFAGCYGKSKIFNSSDSGETWMSDIKEIPGFIISDFVCTNNNYIARTNVGTFISTNKGLNWKMLELNFFNLNFKKAGKNIYATSYNGLLVSKDDGLNWEYTPNDLKDTSMYLTCIEIQDSTVYSSENKKGFVKSTDLGKTWIRPQNKNLPDTTTITSFAIYGNNIFVSSYESGIYLSKDEGESWEKINDGLTITYIHRILIKDDYIYAATAGAGVYKAKLSDFGIINSVENNIENLNYLYAYPPYPMPAINEVRTLIYWDTSIDIENDEMFVYDIYGTKVAGKEKLRIDKLTAYSGNLVWDCSGVPTGIYLINIKHGTQNRTIKAIVTK